MGQDIDGMDQVQTVSCLLQIGVLLLNGEPKLAQWSSHPLLHDQVRAGEKRSAGVYG